MPTYQFTSPRTGRTYGVQSDAELPDDDIDALVNDLDFEAAREAGVQPGVDPAVLQQGPVGSFLQSIPQTFSKVGSGMISGAGRILDKASESLSQATGLPKGGDMFQRMADYGDELSTSADLTFPTNPQNPVAGTIGSGAAQGLSLLAGGLAGKALTGSNVAMTAVPAVSGFLSGANQGIQTAEEIGVQSPLAQLGTGMAFGGLEVLTERLGGIGSKAGTEALTRAVRQTAGQMLKSTGKAVGSEALEEVLAGRSQAALTRLIASEDPSNPGFTRTGVNLDALASEIVNLEAMKLEALGGAAGGTVFAGVQALANRQLPNDPTTSPNQTPAPTQPPAPGQPGAPAPMGAGAPGPAAVSPLIGIAQRGGAVDVTLPDDTGELTAEEVQDLEMTNEEGRRTNAVRQPILQGVPDQVPSSRFQVPSSQTLPPAANPDPAQTITGSNVQTGTEMPVPPPTAEAGAGAGAMGSFDIPANEGLSFKENLGAQGWSREQVIVKDQDGAFKIRYWPTKSNLTPDEVVQAKALFQQGQGEYQFNDGTAQAAQPPQATVRPPANDPASSIQQRASSQEPAPLMLPSNRLGRGLADMMPRGVSLSPSLPVSQSPSLPVSPSQSLASAYTTAARGQSSQMIRLADVFAAARQQNPALTPAQFQAQVMAEYDAGTVLLEGAGSPQEAQSAGLRIDGTPVGSAVRMMVPPGGGMTNGEGRMRNDGAPLQNPASRATAAAMASDSGAAQNAEPSPGGLSEAEVQKIRSLRPLPDVGFKGKKPTRLFRGVGERTGKGAYNYGKGLYTTTDKQHAKQFGAVQQMDTADSLPATPLYFATENAFETFLSQLKYDALKVRSASEFERTFGPDIGPLLKQVFPDADGVQIGTGAGAFYVKWPSFESSRVAAGTSSSLPLSPSQSLESPATLAANQSANEAILRNLGLPTAKGSRTWGGKKIQAALRKLALDERYPATTRRMAQELAARPLDNLLLKIEADARLNWAGLYQPFNNGRGELSLNTRTMGRGELDIGISLVHEVLHHATYQALRNPKTAAQKQAAKDLQALYTRAKAALAANEQLSEFDYELSDVDEFITGLWTRADFQTALAGIPADAAPTLGQRVRSLLDEIFRVLSELVTGKAVPPGSVLEASMAATLRIMEDGRTAVEMEAMLAPLQNPASNIQQPATPNETQSRFASPNPADRSINGPRTDELVTAEANAWLNSMDQQAAIEAFVAGQVPLSLDTAERAAATLIANLSEQAATAKTEMARMWAHVQGRRMARVWTTEHLSADPARALRQRGVVNNTILAPIAPVLAAQELLEDRAKKVIDQRFDGGTEGAVEKVKDIATTAGEQAGTDLAADLEGETTPDAPTRPGQPPRPRKLAAKHPNVKKMLDALRKKMFPGMTWADIFTQLPETQKARQREIYRRLMLDERLRNLTPEERLALTNELDKAWLRERRKVFMRELEKANVLGETKPKDREKVKAAAPRLLRLMNLGMLNSEMFREALAKEYGLNMIDAAAAADLRALGERIQKAPEGLPRRKLEQQLVERLQKLSGYTLWQVIDSWWTASVLSGWRTQVDIGLSIANGIEDIGLGSIVTALRSGNKDVAVRGLAALFGRIPSAFMEAVNHVATGNKAMMRSFELEVKQAMEGGNLLASDVGRQMWDRGGWRKVPGGFMVFYGRLMTALDHVNSSSTREGAKAMALARHPELYEKALRITTADRLAARQQARLEMTGGAVPATQQERIEENARVREILEQGIPAEVLAEATEVGRAAALQGEPTGLGGALLDAVLSAVSVVNRKAQELANRPNPDRLTRQGAAITAALVPMARALTGTKFARTVAHSINRTASYVPGLGAYAVGQQGRTGAFGDILAAKQVIGTLVGIALYLAFDDDDDEKGIEDSWKDKTPQQKAQLYAQGKQPFTIWTRDDRGRVRNWNYQQWGVAGIVNTVAAMLKQKGSEAGTLNVLMSSITQGAMSFTDKAQLQGLQTVFGENFRSTDPASGIAASLNKWAAQTVGGVVPRLVKDIDMVASPELRDTSEWWQKWAKEVPMLRQLSSGKRIDILGQDIKLDRGPLSRVTQLGTADPVYRLLGNLNARDVWLPDPSQGVRVVKFSNGTRRNMNPQEKDRYQRLTGAAYRAYLEKEGPALMQMPPEDAQEAVSKATARLRATAAYQATH